MEGARKVVTMYSPSGNAELWYEHEVPAGYTTPERWLAEHPLEPQLEIFDPAMQEQEIE